MAIQVPQPFTQLNIPHWQANNDEAIRALLQGAQTLGEGIAAPSIRKQEQQAKLEQLIKQAQLTQETHKRGLSDEATRDVEMTKKLQETDSNAFYGKVHERSGVAEERLALQKQRAIEGNQSKMTAEYDKTAGKVVSGGLMATQNLLKAFDSNDPSQIKSARGQAQKALEGIDRTNVQGTRLGVIADTLDTVIADAERYLGGAKSGSLNQAEQGVLRNHVLGAAESLYDMHQAAIKDASALFRPEYGGSMPPLGAGNEERFQGIFKKYGHSKPFTNENQGAQYLADQQAAQTAQQHPAITDQIGDVYSRGKDALANFFKGKSLPQDALTSPPPPVGLPPQKAALNPAGFGQSSTPKLLPDDQKAFDWAQSNPKDPRSLQILKKLGVQ